MARQLLAAPLRVKQKLAEAEKERKKLVSRASALEEDLGEALRERDESRRELVLAVCVSPNAERNNLVARASALEADLEAAVSSREELEARLNLAMGERDDALGTLETAQEELEAAKMMVVEPRGRTRSRSDTGSPAIRAARDAAMGVEDANSAIGGARVAGRATTNALGMTVGMGGGGGGSLERSMLNRRISGRMEEGSSRSTPHKRSFTDGAGGQGAGGGGAWPSPWGGKGPNAKAGPSGTPLGGTPGGADGDAVRGRKGSDIRKISEKVAQLKEASAPMMAKASTSMRSMADKARGMMDKATTPQRTVNRDADGNCPLNRAASAGDIQAVRALLAANNPIDVPNRRGLTALLCAACEKKTAVVEVLIECGAQVRHLDREGMSALHYASWKGEAGMVRVLLKKGLDVNLTTQRGNTPLTIASRFGHASVVEALLANGADVNTPDGKGKTPLAWVRACGRAGERMGEEWWGVCGGGNVGEDGERRGSEERGRGRGRGGVQES